MNLKHFFTELKSRNVYKVAVTYAVVAWLLLQIATQVFPFLRIPDWAIRLVIVLVAFGFPIALIVAWAFEITPEGIKRTETVAPSRSIRHRTGRKLTATAGVLAALAVGLFVFQSMQSHRATTPTSSTTLSPSRAVTSGLVSEKSIAVLPFENLSDARDDAFFADGIQDDLLTSLSKVKELTVIARSSVMIYRGAAVDGKLREIGKTLGVFHVLEGSVRRFANRVVVNVRLIDTRDDRQLWSEHYDRTLTDTIGLQGELAAEIAHALRARLNPEEKARLATKPTNNPEAYLLYLLARDKERTVASQDDSNAVDRIYGQATAIDPKFASALARQSMLNSGMYYVTRQPERKAKAHALAMEALGISPDLPEAHLALGECFRMTDRNYESALKEFSIAAQAIPNDPELLGKMGALHRRLGRWREALAYFQGAQQVDPRVPHDDDARTFAALRHWDKATVRFRQLIEMAPDDVWIKAGLASVFMNGEGDFAASRRTLDTIPYPRRDAKGNPVWNPDLAVRWELFMLERDFAGAEKLLVEFPLAQLPRPLGGWKNFLFACTAWGKGDQDKARELFEKVRPVVESSAQSYPDDPIFLTWLGVVDAYLGRKGAVAESLRALAIVDENDAVERPHYLTNLALVYALTGDKENAITLVEQLLTTPAPEGLGANPVTLTQLKSWRWDSLRTNPRFEKILEEPEPKTIY